MGGWHRRGETLAVVVAAALTFSESAQLPAQQAPVVADGSTSTDGGNEERGGAASRGRSFALSADFREGPEGFTLFKDSSLAGWDGPMGRLELRFRQQALPGPRLLGLPTMAPGISFRAETAADGNRRLVLGPIYREWSDLTAWEKFGVALSYAGAAAAVVHFAAEVADALDR